MPATPCARTLRLSIAKDEVMPKVSRDSAEQVEDHGVVEDRHEDVEGYTINFLSFRGDADGTPRLKGLPGDRCSAPHWGCVLKGRMTFRFDDHEEAIEAGDAFYLPPGHIPVVEAGTEYVQFSPAEELRRVSETMTRNFQAMMREA
jgi:mannose-6-phosphate isomerase-like protein (cupin superfamily)